MCLEALPLRQVLFYRAACLSETDSIRATNMLRCGDKSKPIRIKPSPPEQRRQVVLKVVMRQKPAPIRNSHLHFEKERMQICRQRQQVRLHVFEIGREANLVGMRALHPRRENWIANLNRAY